MIVYQPKTEKESCSQKYTRHEQPIDQTIQGPLIHQSLKKADDNNAHHEANSKKTQILDRRMINPWHFQAPDPIKTMKRAPIQPPNGYNQTIEDLDNDNIAKLVPILNPIPCNILNLATPLTLINNLKDNHRKGQMQPEAHQKYNIQLIDPYLMLDVLPQLYLFSLPILLPQIFVIGQ